MFKQVAAALALMASLGTAQAALITLPAWDALYPSLAGAQFKKATDPTSGVSVALGAHAYKNGILLPNDGVGTFQADLGTYLAEDRANWSFNFFVDAGNYCLSCLRVDLEMDRDAGAGVNFGGYYLQPVRTAVSGNSWNLEMDFLETLLGSFNPSQAGSYDFRLTVRDTDALNVPMAQVQIRVNVGQQVPEPGSLALAGLALLGLALRAKRR